MNLGADRYFNKIGSPESVFGELAYGIRQTVAQRKAEDALRQSEEKYRTIVELSPDGIVSVNAQGLITSVNKAILERTGFSEKEFMGKHFTHLTALQKEPPPNYKKLILAFLSGEFPDSFEFNYTCKDGTQRSSDARIGLLKQKGELIGLQVIFRDITERKQIINALQESETKLRTLLDAANVLVQSLDATGKFVYVNKEWKKLLGYTDADLKTLNLMDIIRSDYHKHCWELFKKVINGEPVCEVEAVFVAKDGKEIMVRGNAKAILRDGKFVSTVGFFLDITERKKAEEDLKQTLTKLATLNEKLGVVGKLTRHDARNKLSVIINNIYLAKKRLAENLNPSEFLDAIESASEQIGDIFEFAGIYEKVGTEELDYVNVSESIDEAIMLVSCSAQKNFVNQCEGLVVLADSLLRQTFYNLLDNSLLHGEKVTQTLFYYKELKDQLNLYYEDDGKGIPENEKEKIFEEGYGKGTGYGLYLIKKTCEAYGWTIQETGVCGKGAQFTITIPKTCKNGKIGYMTN